MIVRSWNVFHGNSVPPRRRGYLREMVELASRDRPAVLCLQEVPPWALDRLEDWSGMRVHGMVARGPAPAGRRLRRGSRGRHHGLFRSRLAGQAKAILVDPGTREREPRRRSRSASRAASGASCTRCASTGIGVVANLHASNAPATPSRRRRRSSSAARAFLDGHAAPGEARILAGDLNHTRAGTRPATRTVAPASTTCSSPALPPGRSSSGRSERRMHNGVVLSDHAPVERVVG